MAFKDKSGEVSDVALSFIFTLIAADKKSYKTEYAVLKGQFPQNPKSNIYICPLTCSAIAIGYFKCVFRELKI